MQSVSTTATTPAFTNIVVLPSYGWNKCVISWVINTLYTDSSKYGVNLYCSRDGLTDWHLVNNKPLPPTISTYGDSIKYKGQHIDDEHQCRYWNQAINWYYRLELVEIKYSGLNKLPLYTTICFSPSVGAFHTLSKVEFATLRSMIENEILQKDAIDVFILRPKGLEGDKYMSTSKITPTIDYLTGEQTGVSTDNEAFGQAFLGGYSTPIKAQLILDTVSTKQSDDQTGQGSTINKIVNITGYSFPRLIRGDMIVVPQTDERYFFNEYTQEYLFKGVFPFKFQGQMQLIPRNQVEYKINVRDLVGECC